MVTTLPQRCTCNGVTLEMRIWLSGSNVERSAVVANGMFPQRNRDGVDFVAVTL